MKNKNIVLLVVLLLGISAVAALAGGPLIIFDETTRTPYAYGVATVNVYTDLGSNGFLTGAESDAHTAMGYAEWTNVPTAYFSAAVAGDFASVGLPDITGANAGLVVGTDNGGGIHVMYDDDGTITFNFFGAPPGVLGIASPDFAVGGTNEIIESWAMLNGTAADPADVGGVSFSGVFTHEFGHTINLAHTQTNGAVGFFGDPDGPGFCATPYASGGLTFNEFETMYPFLDPSAGSVGIQQATVNVLDDIAAISDIYPDAGWPATHGTITGRVLDPTGSFELTGVNVIVRNVADPYEDANSALSGDYTQGALGPDGLFTLNGLTPGADYVVYIDEIVAGGFSTSPISIPGDGDEEYWNAAESADPGVDDPCDYTFILATAGSPFTADIIANGDPNALDLGDDDYIEVALPFSFPFCGNSYTSVFVGSNGFLTFEEGDLDFSESVVEFLNGAPRIAPLWVDLNPSAGGSVTAMADGADFVVTYNNIGEFPSTGSNNFTVTMRADGTYDIAYGLVTAADGLSGRTEGRGADDPGQTDLSAEPQPIGVGLSTVYEHFTGFDNDLDSQYLAFGTCVIPDPPAIAVDPASLSAKLIPGDTDTQALIITNLGDLDLTFDILSDQLFATVPGGGTPGIIVDLDQGPAGDPNIDNGVRLTKFNEDATASRPGKPEVSPLSVPLPHIYALSLLLENFDGGFPVGWTAIDNEGNGVVWQVPQQGTGNHTGGTGDAAGANSDYVGPADYDTELRTPPITGFGPNVVLSYVANYQNFANWDYLDVDVSTDGGANWTTVLSWNEDHGGFFGPPGEQVALNLDSFVAGASEFIVRWRWYDPTTTGDYDWYVQIDDVAIVSDEPLTPCSFLTVNPTSGTVPGDGVQPLDVTFDATGFEPGTYDCELLIFSNAVNEPRVVVPVQMVVAHPAYVDVMPEKCPNVLQLGNGQHGSEDSRMSNRATIKVALLGSDGLDLNDVDLSTLELAGVPVSSVKVRDKYQPCEGAVVPNATNGNGQCKCTYKGTDYTASCNNTKHQKDGYKDADLRFDKEDVVAALGSGSDVLSVKLTGQL